MPKRTDAFVNPYLLIIFLNVMIYLLEILSPLGMLYQFGLIPSQFWSGKVYQILTYGFLHDTSMRIPIHLIFNMYAFYFLSKILEFEIGRYKVIGLYFFSMFLGGLFVVLLALLNLQLGGEILILDSFFIPTVGASGGVFGLLAVFGILYPEMEILLLFFPVKAKNAVWVSLLLGYLLVLFSGAPLSNSSHLGGAVAGFLFYRFLISKNPSQKELPYALFRNKIQKHLQNSSEDQYPLRPEAIRGENAELFMEDFRKNQSLLLELKSLNPQDALNKLNPLQISDANICPPSTYNPEDSFCLRCEWLVNCEFRKRKSV